MPIHRLSLNSSEDEAMKMIRTLTLGSTMWATALLAGCVAIGHHNPVDPVSNPHALDYSDVYMRHPDFDEPFVRDGIVSEPQRLRAIQAGLTEAQGVAALGQPLQVQDGPLGVEWDYDFKFLMPQSQNYLVCQYKVVFDDQQVVRDAVWRRRQCLDLVKG